MHIVQCNILYAIEMCSVIALYSNSINPIDETCLVTCVVSLTDLCLHGLCTSDFPLPLNQDVSRSHHNTRGNKVHEF